MSPIFFLGFILFRLLPILEKSIEENVHSLLENKSQHISKKIIHKVSQTPPSFVHLLLLISLA